MKLDKKQFNGLIFAILVVVTISFVSILKSMLDSFYPSPELGLRFTFAIIKHVLFVVFAIWFIRRFLKTPTDE